MPVLIFFSLITLCFSPSKLFAVEPELRAKMIPIVCEKSAELEVQLENIKLLKEEMKKTLLEMNEAELKKETYHRVGKGMVTWGLIGTGVSYSVGVVSFFTLITKGRGMRAMVGASAGLWAGLLTTGAGYVVIKVGGRKFKKLEQGLKRATIELSKLEAKMLKDWAELETLKNELSL